MRRPAPRPLAAALADMTRESAPAGPLASVQACWEQVAGPVVAAEAEPVSERDGTLTIACRSATWANELQLLGPDLLERLNAALAGRGTGPLAAVRVRVGRPG